MRAFVTGASGFIGRHLVRRLVERGVAVRCLVRATSRTEPLEGLGVELVEGELATSGLPDSALRDCQLVYHLAGRTSALRPGQLQRVNAAGTFHLLERCTQLPQAPRLLIVSSLAAAGTSPPGRWREGHERPRPVSHYGRSKRGGERAAERFAGQVPISIVRPGIVFGEENLETLPVFRSVYRHRVHVVPTLFPTRVALIHQADLIDLLLAVADRGQCLAAGGDRRQGYYFAADPRCPRYVEWGRLIARAAGRRSPFILMVPEPLLWTAAGAAHLVQLRRGASVQFNLDKIREATAGDWVCRIERGYDQLGFQHRFPLEHRLRQTVQWYVQHGWM